MKKLKMLLALMLVMALIASLASCTIIEGLTGSEQSGTVDGEDLENPENPSDPEQPNDPGTPEEPQEPENPSDPNPETPEEPDQPAEPEPAPHEHTFATEWSKDDNRHWHAASCEHSELKADEAEHVYDVLSGNCVCGDHIHVYSADWMRDESSHWRGALCEHIELKVDEAAHVFVDGYCVCGEAEPVAPHVHTFSDEWTYNDDQHWHAATCGHNGLRGSLAAHVVENGVCACGYRPHVHTYSTEWSKNDNKHWHNATCEHTELKADEAEHAYDSASGNCVCGAHVHVYSAEWTNDDTKHWHVAICEHSELTSGVAEHLYINDVCECGKEEPDYGPEPADVLKSGTPIGTMTQIFKMSARTDSEGRNCRVLQGGCTDGTYYYAFFNDSLKDSLGNHSPDSASVCYKYNVATKKLVATYENLMVEHVNDATYYPLTNEILVAHCSPNKNLISVFDADTMELKRKFTIDFEIYAIAYDAFENCYWLGLSYGDDFAKVDLNFNLIKRFEGVPYGYTKQGMDVDSEYIYLARYSPNCILVYDKQGNFVERIGLPTTSYELENIIHIGSTFYLGYYTSSAGGRFYSFEMTAVSGSGSVSVDMSADDAILTLKQRTDAAGNICKVAQCSATDGTYIYFFMNNDVNTDYISSLYKYEIATGKIVATLDGFRTGHTNDVTYNSKTKELIVANNVPNFTLTIIDAETLEVKRNVTVDSDVYAIAYDEANDCYYASNRATHGFFKLDSEFNLVKELTVGVTCGYSRQAIDTDGEYIYMLRSAANCVLVYRVDGTFVGMSYLLPSADTAQSICHIGDTFYIGYNISKSGGTIYTVEIDVTDTEA